MISDEELFLRAKATACRRVLSHDTTAGQVGCALVTTRGNVYTGVCIDVPCGIGFCAEHNAIGAMITAGESAITTIVAVNYHGNILPPCGRCREFIFQVDAANAHTRVILGAERVATIQELLPDHWAAAW